MSIDTPSKLYDSYKKYDEEGKKAIIRQWLYHWYKLPNLKPVIDSKLKEVHDTLGRPLVQKIRKSDVDLLNLSQLEDIWSAVSDAIGDNTEATVVPPPNRPSNYDLLSDSRVTTIGGRKKRKRRRKTRRKTRRKRRSRKRRKTRRKKRRRRRKVTRKNILMRKNTGTGTVQLLGPQPYPFPSRPSRLSPFISSVTALPSSRPR